MNNSIKNKKILLIGGAGYIGGLTTDVLIRDGFDVTIYDNLLYEERFLKNVNFIYGDIRDTKKILNIIEDFEIIILMSALVGDSACNIDPKLTEEINLFSIKNLCNSIPLSKHVIFMSTCSVYGAQDGILNEESKTNPLSLYAITKLEAEKYVLKRNGTIFRLGTVFGLGDTYSRIRLDLVVNVLTMKAIKDGVININGGEQWRPIIAVKDIAEYILEACHHRHSGIFILAKENILIRELGERITNIIPNTKINYTKISFQDARNYRVSNKKSLDVFQYKPKITIEEEIIKMTKLFLENRIKNPKNCNYHNGDYLNNIKEKLTWKINQ